MLETLFKIFLTIGLSFVVITSILSVNWVWKSQIDVKETFKFLVKNKIENTQGVLVTRDPNSIYQDGKVVGTFSDEPKEKNNELFFTKIYNAKYLNKDEFLEYRRIKCKIKNIGLEGEIDVFQGDSSVILRGVTCKKI
ncbi:MAG: hypothetical protein A2493_00070 [Candidatus Magasanikbacteria bacterium RIFOXYC12_FULL_33_11]|uniref:Uncharacterized protein n=1 Tax=Candidatus Magasanikbacteria bacterium RIFOXYC12_FULL_33_11 TaxID=1798701 RepID=A0A1F6NQU8_9BACT|nr:MAG: hypothetical protein A2493_00070 [Candidatus Magasanikbacteria bacterium RIFOXYC12_FULL_33_11]